MAFNFSDAFCDSLRLEGDPEVDGIIAAVAERGDIKAVNAILRSLTRNDQSIPAELPDDIEEWLRKTDCIPGWVDMERIDRATALFAEHGMRMSFILSTSSLIHAYAAKKGVKVLMHTYRMGQQPYRRIGETAQFVLMVLAPGSFGPEGQGIPAIQKIRLMHSAIRYLIGRTGTWDEEEFGVPICQEDLLGTLITFSGLVVRDLKHLGIELSYEETEDYMYIWRMIGEMLGIRTDIIPANYEESEQIANLIARRHHGPSPEGRQLASALLEMYASLTPGTLFDGVVPALIRYLVGDEICDWLEIPRSSWSFVSRGFGAISHFMNLIDQNTYVIGSLIDKLGMALLNHQAFVLSDYERAAFTIPSSLRDFWDQRGMLNGPNSPKS